MTAANGAQRPQPARDELAERIRELERENRRLRDERRGPYSCCKHCADDPAYHVENARNTHETSCPTCDSVLLERAERAEARVRELEQGSRDTAPSTSGSLTGTAPKHSRRS